MPVATPVTTPVLPDTEATDEALLLHVPPVEVSVSVVAAPVHTADAPHIAAGSGFTVIIFVLVVVPQPLYKE